MNSHIIFYALLLALSLSACRSSIDGTKTITMSKAERRELKATPEELLAAKLEAEPLSHWATGRRFIVADNKASLVLYPKNPNLPHSDSLAGHTIYYVGTFSQQNPIGHPETLLAFRSGNDTLIYNTGKDLKTALSRISSADIPMLIDVNLANRADSLLSGKKLWTRARLRYDSISQPVSGAIFLPVDVIRVVPGNMVFPMRVDFSDESGTVSSYYMSPGNSSTGSASTGSRSFSSLFLLSDPRQDHRNISDDVWHLICRGQVRIGMTKEECKLALGNPSEVDAGHNWNKTIDLWRYADGSFLRFNDGLLVDFR